MSAPTTSPTLPQVHHRSSRRWIFRCLAVLFGLSVSLTLVEITLRVLGLGYGHSPEVDHPVFHHWNPRDNVVRAWGTDDEFGGFDNRTNHDGFIMSRELPPADEPSLIFLGDSFTFGGQVPEEERFATLVGRDLGVTALNFGNNSACALLSRLQLEYFADRFRPLAVVYQIYANDIESEQEMRRIAVHDDAGRIVAVPGSSRHWSVLLARRSYVARLARKTYLQWQFSRTKRKRQGEFVADVWVQMHARPITEMYTRDELKNYEASILDIAEFCRENDCPLFLMVVPDLGSIKQGLSDHLNEYIAAFAREHNLRTIDLSSRFRELPVEELFFSIDIHFTKRGHEVVAAAIAEALTRELPALSATPESGEQVHQE